MIAGISVIICTYNPDSYIFDRVLRAIAACERPEKMELECLIIDNNSEIPLAQQSYITNILRGIDGGRIVVEPNQGLTNSRRRGIKEAAFTHLLFIDDDNEIDRDYLKQSSIIIRSNPALGAFNAGIIRVNFIGIVEDWYKNKAKSYFQESNLTETIFKNDSESFHHWPFGTGLIVSKVVCDNYVIKLEKGLFTLIDRNGKFLTSGGDGQLISCAIGLGYSVGRAKELKLNHLIAARKASINYLTKVDYGIYYSGELFLKETFPQNLVPISSSQELRLLIKLFFVEGIKAVIRNDTRKFSIQKASLLGRLAGNRYALNKKASWYLDLLSRRYIN
jgi:glycosyltransferase involved in cell wall biosynthesis